MANRAHQIARVVFVLSVAGRCFGATDEFGFTTVEIASGLAYPVDVTHAPGDGRRVFVVEQVGLVRLIRDGDLLAEPFLDIRHLTRITAEGGLLGITFHPEYADNRALFVNYTDLEGDTVIARYHRSDDPDRALPDGEVLLRIEQPGGLHNGGCIQFGTDGYLYIGMGDGGRGNPQAPDSLLGKMLRIAVDGTGPYRIPADNPFVNDPDVLDEIWAIGLRNPWRFSIDAATGDLYIGDVGSTKREEINYQPGRSTGGENYGWPCREGTLCVPPLSCYCREDCECDLSVLVDPLHQFKYRGGAVVGGHVYRGCAIPELDGWYFCYYLYQFYVLRVGADGASYKLRDVSAKIGTNACTSFGVDDDGELLICDRLHGAIHKLVPDPGREALDCNENGTYDTCERGDADGDGVVELDDLRFFASCMTAPCERSPCRPPRYANPCCRIMDFDSDGDVDLLDFARFQPIFGGSP